MGLSIHHVFDRDRMAIYLGNGEVQDQVRGQLAMAVEVAAQAAGADRHHGQHDPHKAQPVG